MIVTFGGTFLLYVTSSISGTEDRRYAELNNGKNLHLEKILEPFSVIVADYGVNFSLEYADKHRVYLYKVKVDEVLVPNYKIKNDTLYLDDSTVIGGVKPRFFTSKIKAIIGLGNNEIIFDKVVAEKLDIQMNGGRIHGSFEPSASFNMNIKAIESTIDIINSNLDLLIVDLYKTKINVSESSVDQIDGEIRNYSSLVFKDEAKISLDTDKTSNYKRQK